MVFILLLCVNKCFLTRNEVIRTYLDSVLSRSRRGNPRLQLAFGDRKVLRPRERLQQEHSCRDGHGRIIQARGVYSEDPPVCLAI